MPCDICENLDVMEIPIDETSEGLMCVKCGRKVIG